MATVYLARDLRHDRQVALKLLDPELGAVLGVERFLSEISVTAKLQHPNLLPLFDSGEADGLLLPTTSVPFVEGESLVCARLDREKQLPIEEALRMTIAIATALDYAHGHGVIHRDLKPENILLQHGQPVLADFGIALAVSRAGGARITQTGLSLGTPQYMSPEQATGDRTIDGRTDIYSLGAVAYEMLSGDPPHTGATAQTIIAKLMTDEARPLTTLRRSVPASVDGAVRRSLEKLPADRWSTAREFAEALSSARSTDTVPTATRARDTRSKVSTALPWVVAVVGVAVAVGALVAPSSRRRPVSSDYAIRFALAPDDSQREFNASGIPYAMSPDDRRVAYTGSGPLGARLFIRNLDEMDAHPLPGSEGATQPFFSADGRWIAFVSGNQLLRESVDGGVPTPILSVRTTAFAGASWVFPDTIIASIDGGLVAIPATGGSSVLLSPPDSAHGEAAKWGPHVLNDRLIAFVSVPTTGLSGNRVAVFDRRNKKVISTTYSGTTVLGAVDDRVVWLTGAGVVMAAKFDPSGVLGSAEPMPLESVYMGAGGAGKAAMSANGSLVYRRGLLLSELVVIDERGTAALLLNDRRLFYHPRWSPDGSRVAVSISKPGGADIWLVDVRTGLLSKLTTATGTNDVASWTPDSKRIAYSNDASRRVEWMSVDAQRHRDDAPRCGHPRL